MGGILIQFFISSRVGKCWLVFFLFDYNCKCLLFDFGKVTEEIGSIDEPLTKD